MCTFNKWVYQITVLSTYIYFSVEWSPVTKTTISKINTNLYLCRNILAASANLSFVKKNSVSVTTDALFSISCIRFVTSWATYCSCWGLSGTGSISDLKFPRYHSFTFTFNMKLTKTFLQYIGPNNDELQWESGPRIWHEFAANSLQEDVEL